MDKCKKERKGEMVLIEFEKLKDSRCKSVAHTSGLLLLGWNRVVLHVDVQKTPLTEHMFHFLITYRI